MTNDDRFDDLLDEAAREYNRAPEPPRAAMWEAIAEARRQAPAPVVSLDAARSRRRARRVLLTAAMAATLLIGVVIGRVTTGTGHTTNTATGPATTAPVEPGTATLPNGTAGVSASEPAQTARAAQGVMPVVLPRVVAVRGTRPPRSVPSERGAPSRGERSRTDASLPYRIAATQHLVTTEALLVSLRADVRAGRQDSTIGIWASDLLGTTRMLIDSPAGHDPKLQQLLQDLELVLAQIARLPGARGEAADLGLIDDAVQRRQIMTRLRALSPGT